MNNTGSDNTSTGSSHNNSGNDNSNNSTNGSAHCSYPSWTSSSATHHLCWDLRTCDFNMRRFYEDSRCRVGGLRVVLFQV